MTTKKKPAKKSLARLFNPMQFLKSLTALFQSKKKVSIGLYGPPNAGKSTLANLIIQDLLKTDKEYFQASSVSHETREVSEVENITLKHDGKILEMNLSDTPGIATKVDFEDFVKRGMKKKDAIDRAKQATQGIIDSIKWIEKVDCVILVMDSTKNPYNQVNITLVANLAARKKKFLIVANKTDLKSSNIDKIKIVFPDRRIVPVSAKTGKGLNDLYKAIVKEF